MCDWFLYKFLDLVQMLTELAYVFAESCLLERKKAPSNASDSNLHSLCA